MLTIRHLEPGDIPIIAAAFQKLGWNKPASQYERYLAEQQNNHRVVLLALVDAVFAGYLTVCWAPEYPYFRDNSIPEIQDFNVLPEFRRQGIGSRLMDEAERLISERASAAGIGVGLYADYGAAQRLYVKRGYVPDGRGVFYRHQPVPPGNQVPVDDDLVLYFTRDVAGR